MGEAEFKPVHKPHAAYVPGRGGGGKIPYPTHVWSPAGGWYAQPANWKANTMVMGAVLAGIVAVTWSVSANLEQRPRMPEKGRFFPSRYWSKQIREHEAKERDREGAGGSS
ncbi:hypothetical protein EJ08DRAFT_604576 [Tothia fuscella]|uniref:Uncharacterized protein n=1 Tax=Tothia fuscella TaxID=1048955 RepID=A0A9P4U2A8_9PEZI|nr:hypothetical protein EJ08DRAFT_604576 [Tothia fuscella]